MNPSGGHGNGEEVLRFVCWGSPTSGPARVPGRKDPNSLQQHPAWGLCKGVRSGGGGNKQLNKLITNRQFSWIRYKGVVGRLRRFLSVKE